MKEDALTQLLRSIPLRPAPTSLKPRVMQQLAKSRAMPWWTRGFAHWPIAMRVSFLAASLALIAVSILYARWATLDDGVLHRLEVWSLSWINPATWSMASATAPTSASDIGIYLARFLASDWLSVLMTIAALLYAALTGLGVLAYRTLYLPPHSNR